MFLLDTMVISEVRKRNSDPGVSAWIDAVHQQDLFISTISVAELEVGIEKQKSINPIFSNELARWLELTLRTYGDRVLPVDVPVARRWGRLAIRIGNKGLDLAIAATALEHHLTVVTRNVAHFQPTGVAILNPFRPA